MPGKSHVHKYRRAIGRLTEKNKDSKFINYYKCVLNDCTHYMRAELILGKKAICNRCLKEFNLPMSVAMLTNIPHCKGCTKVKVIINKKGIEDEIMDESEELEDVV